MESNHEKGTKTSYTDGFVPLCTSKKAAMLSAKLISIIKQIRTFSEEEVRIKNFWWSICDHIRKICSRRIFIERVFEVDIGDLFASLDVIKDDYAVVVEIDAVNKCVDDIAAEFWIEKVSGAEFSKPRPDFAFGQANITCNTQLDQIAFGGCFLRFEAFHLFIDSFMRSLWRINQRIHQFIQLAVKLAYLFFAFIYFAARKLIVILSDDGFSNVLNMLRRKNILHRLLDNVPFDEILLFVFLFAGVK